MTGFHPKAFIKHDDYMTPKYAWDWIKDFIPKDKVIWEAFYGDGESGKILSDLGFNVIHEETDFFTNNLGDVIVSNPPFTKKKAVMTRLKEIDKPFIIICPSSMLNTQYVRHLFKDDRLQIIIPNKRINFKKLIDGKVPDNWGDRCSFDCFYYCWKLDLPNDIVWL